MWDTPVSNAMHFKCLISDIRLPGGVMAVIFEKPEVPLNLFRFRSNSVSLVTRTTALPTKNLVMIGAKMAEIWGILPNKEVSK